MIGKLSNETFTSEQYQLIRKRTGLYLDTKGNGNKPLSREKFAVRVNACDAWSDYVDRHPEAAEFQLTARVLDTWLTGDTSRGYRKITEPSQLAVRAISLFLIQVRYLSEKDLKASGSTSFLLAAIKDFLGALPRREKVCSDNTDLDQIFVNFVEYKDTLYFFKLTLYPSEIVNLSQLSIARYTFIGGSRTRREKIASDYAAGDGLTANASPIETQEKVGILYNDDSVCFGLASQHSASGIVVPGNAFAIKAPKGNYQNELEFLLDESRSKDFYVGQINLHFMSLLSYNSSWARKKHRQLFGGSIIEKPSSSIRGNLAEDNQIELLFQAARSGDLETLERLLSEGTNINSVDIETGDTILLDAARRGNELTLKFLIHRADVDFLVRDVYGRPASEIVHSPDLSDTLRHEQIRCAKLNGVSATKACLPLDLDPT